MAGEDTATMENSNVAGGEKDLVVEDANDLTLTLSRVTTSGRGSRPACFGTTFQEIMFVFVATMTVGAGSFVTGAVTVLSTFVGRDLNMTTTQITWIAASSGYGFLCLHHYVSFMF